MDSELSDNAHNVINALLLENLGNERPAACFTKL